MRYRQFKDTLPTGFAAVSDGHYTADICGAVWTIRRLGRRLWRATGPERSFSAPTMLEITARLLDIRDDEILR